MVVSRKQIFNLRCIFGDFSLFLFYLLVTVLIPTHFYIERYHWCPHKLLHCHICISVSHSDLAVLTYNLGQNIYRLFHVSGKFLFTTSETELVCELPHKLPNDLKLKKWGDFMKITEMLGFDGKYSGAHQKAKFRRFSMKNHNISIAKHFTKKPILLNFTNLSTTLCPRL